MAIDNDMLMVVILAVGLIAFGATNSRDAGEKDVVNRLGEIPMEIDTIEKWDPQVVAKKADLGDLPYRGRQICEYLTNKAAWCYEAQRWFENGLQNRDAAWLQHEYPKQFDWLQAVIRECDDLDIEFRSLWLELTEMTNGGAGWMQVNQWVVEVPRKVSDRLQNYFRISPDSIQRYQQQFIEQFGRDQLQLNQALHQKLSQFQNAALGVIQGQANFFKAFAERQSEQIDRLENQINQIEMEVDDEGQFLLQNPLDPGQVRYQVTRNLEYRDLDGVLQQRTITDSINAPQHLLGQGYGGYGPQDDYDDYNTGQGWDMGGGGESDKFGVRKNKPPAKVIQQAQNRYSATNMDGARGASTDDVREMYDMGNQQSFSYEAQPTGTERVNRSPPTYSTAQVNVLSEGIPKNAFQRGQIAKSTDASYPAQADDYENIQDFAANEVRDLEPSYKPANTTRNIKREPQNSYTAIEQATSPRGSYIVGKRARTQSFSQGQELPAYKAPRTVEDEARSGGQVDVDSGIRDLKTRARTDTAAITYGADM